MVVDRNDKIVYDSNQIKMTINDSVLTHDTALAAYLVTQGFGSPIIEYENSSRAFFLFTNKPEITDFIDNYDAGRAEGNIVLFFVAYQTLLRRIKDK